jgi:hypothetical protein
MAYCPKCGVEVEKGITKCPLCEFPIPDIEEKTTTKDSKYPQAINTYKEDHLGKKNKAFFSISIIAISMMIILGIIYLVYPWNHLLIKYIAVAGISIFALIFFSMGYLKFWYNFIGIYLTILVGLFCVYILTGIEYNWFFDYGIPIITLIALDICIFILIFKYNRHRSQFIYLPTNLILVIIVFTAGLDGIISINVLGYVKLSWSLIVMVSGIGIIALLQGIYHRIPEKSRQALKKKMHF